MGWLFFFSFISSKSGDNKYKVLRIKRRKEMTYIKELEAQVEPYATYLRREERSYSTIEQYKKSIWGFLSWAKEKGLAKATLIAYKEKLQEECQASSVNTKLAAINGFLVFCGKGDMKVKQLKIQKPAYSSREQELTREEYNRLIRAAERKKNEKLSLILQTICGTGIRVSELAFITAEAVWLGEAAIHMKRKNRKVLLPDKLCRILRGYLKENDITSGPVFVTRSGRPLDRSNIWKMMKKLCADAQVEPGKVFPHNLRHLFARCFYSVDKDLAKLADILGHSSINTTRIYIISSGVEHRKCMDALGLVIGRESFAP